jgi:hypothetical protein
LSNYGITGDSAIALAASLQLMPHAKEVFLQNNNIDVKGAHRVTNISTSRSSGRAAPSLQPRSAPPGVWQGVLRWRACYGRRTCARST